MNRANIVILVIAAAALLAVGSAQTQRSQPSEQIGRYQLFAGEHPIIGSAQSDKAILRIDTVTGRVDEWAAGVDKNGTPVDHWYQTGQR